MQAIIILGRAILLVILIVAFMIWVMRPFGGYLYLDIESGRRNS
jgi:hypothetical protein